MIRYRLQCDKAHEFEAWFGSSKAYDRQAKRGQVQCPECGSSEVSKALMAPGVATRGRRSDVAPSPPPTAQPEATANPEALAQREMQRQLLAVMREVRKEVESKAEYVGPRFADEARRIHHKEAEARGIWGEATLTEARELHEDGIECYPLPRLPEDQN
jgi:hypothetical protein